MQAPLRVPSLEVQQNIVSDLGALLTQSEHYLTEIAGVRARAGSLRQAILTKAFAGQLVAQDLGDEHVTVSPERIRSQSGQAFTAQKRASQKKSQ